MSAFYQSSPIKRTRSTRAEVERRRLELLMIVEAMRPMTVRQVFYQATVKGIVENSLSFLHGAADYIGSLEVPTYIYHLGDFDPSGVNAGQKIESTLREMAPDAEIHFERIGVTLEQIREWDLPTRPTKTSDSRSKGFCAISVELDAIPPTDLRDLVTMAIEQHLPKHQLDILKIAEAEERKLLHGLVGLMEKHL